MPDNKKTQRDDKQQQKKPEMPKQGQQQPISQPGAGKDRDKADKIEEEGGTKVGNDNELEDEDLEEDESSDDDDDQVITQRNPRVGDDSMKDVE